MHILGLDIGSNSVGSAWIDLNEGSVTCGSSVFPAGVDESDDKRGDPKNAKRRMARRTRITLARRSQRKRELRLCLIEAGLLPECEQMFRELLEQTDPWELRQRGLTDSLTPYEFGRVLLHLAQRRGALGLRISFPDEDGKEEADSIEDGKVKAAIGAVRTKMLERKARTFGEYIYMIRAERVTNIKSEDRRPTGNRVNKREYRDPVRNKAQSYEHCADRAMIRDEFSKLWKAQSEFESKESVQVKLTEELKKKLDDESADSVWRHKGLLFGQRRATWDLGTLGRCNLHPAERCVPHADMYASRYRMIETVNNLRIVGRGLEARSLTPGERTKIIAYLSGPLGMTKPRNSKGKVYPAQPKQTVSVTDLRNLMGTSEQGWGRSSKTSQFKFNIENDEDRQINTDWFSREIIHGGVTPEVWHAMPENVKNGLNRAILKYDPDEVGEAEKLKSGAMDWAGLNEEQADALVSAWRQRPRPEAKRLNMSRRAARNLLVMMDRDEPWEDGRWSTEIEARKLIAADAQFIDAATGEHLDDQTRGRYATGTKGSTARDRYYMRKHKLYKDGQPVLDDEGRSLAEPPPAPLISNPVVRKAIHEVRRHIIEYMTTFGRRPDQVYVELAREARMGKIDADRQLFRNRLRNRIKNEIISTFDLSARKHSQQRTACDRVVLCVQQEGICPLCGQGKITTHMAARGDECEIAHIIPRASGGHNGLSNIVLSHTKCNRDMGRRTPRQLWNDGAGFEDGMRWIEGIFGDVKRSSWNEIKKLTGEPLWVFYFDKKDDTRKIEQFKKDVKDIQDMTARQDAATKYATRQVMSYISDAIYDGKGLPERGGQRFIFATDGRWTHRLREEWGLFFDPHQARSSDLSKDQEHGRREKNRGDHHHHAIDAILTACCMRSIQMSWEQREKEADRAYFEHGCESGYDDFMENYRRSHRLAPPSPFTSRDSFRDAVEAAVFGERGQETPICHRPVKRKLIGALHEETLFGPVLDSDGQLTGLYTASKSVTELDPNHVRLPRAESEKEAIKRLSKRRQQQDEADEKVARQWARTVVSSPGYTPAVVDPPPGKSGIVRDPDLRRRLRACLEEAGLDPDQFTKAQAKKLAEQGKFYQVSGVPIRSVVLLRTHADPVVINRKASAYNADTMVPDPNERSMRVYVGGNNHHIEYRVDVKGKWKSEMVTTFDAAQRKLIKLRLFREAGVPRLTELRKLPKPVRQRLGRIMAPIERDHPIVDRRDRGKERFMMSLCEGEMLFMRRKPESKGDKPGPASYFVVAKLDPPSTVVLVPHWDARRATERKDAEGNKVDGSKREQFSVVPSDLVSLAPDGYEHAQKVRVSPLGVVSFLERD